jgi:hypothetical protein
MKKVMNYIQLASGNASIVVEAINNFIAAKANSVHPCDKYLMSTS